MNSYILLRNNKESTSLSLDGLQQIGLKPTDLIWVECQSVCWQYPQEIPELRNLVAVSNEQQSEQTITQKKENVTDSREEIPVTKTELKRVFVEMPVSKNSTITQKDENSLSSDLRKYGGLSHSIKETDEEATGTINTKYSRPLDEIKEMYVKNLEKKEKSLQIKFPKQLQKIAVYAGLVIAGAGLMLIVNAIGSKKSAPAAQEKKQEETIKNTIAVLPAEPVENIIPEPVIEETGLPVEEAVVTATTKEALEMPVKKSTFEKKVAESKVLTDDNKETIEKEKQPIKETIVTKPVSTETISSKLSLKANDYVVGSFGGIRNLEITLHNDSKYVVDKVVAELQYLNPEGIILKTENIYFQSVSPGQKETIVVKKSKRGVKVNYKITSIESKDLSRSMAGL